MVPKFKRQRMVSIISLSLELLVFSGCMTHYEPTVDHTYMTSTQTAYPGTGLNVELEAGVAINLDHWAKILIDGRKILETNGVTSKSTFIALPHGSHQLRIVEWNTGWLVPTEGGTILYDFKLRPGQRGTFRMDMDGLMFMDEPAKVSADYCDWSGVDSVERQ